jgi:multicomponent Na+:H+ antiporter subunit B
MPLLLLFGVFLVFRGHNAPGGGFAGGLVVAVAFVLHGAAFGVAASRRALVLDASTFLSVGLVVALASALPGMLVGQPFLTGVWATIGGVALGTPLVFDVGVFLAVIGVVLTIVFTLADAAPPAGD